MPKKSDKGFTLTELLVVISIISLFSVVVFANYRAGEKQFALQRSTHKLAQDIRQVQSMALASREIGGEIPSGYGIHFNLAEPNKYVLFADKTKDGFYGPGDSEIETLEMEKGINIVRLSGDPLSIVFYPPDPAVLISGDSQISSAFIVLSYQNGSEKKININKAGLIEIE